MHVAPLDLLLTSCHNSLDHIPEGDGKKYVYYQDKGSLVPSTLQMPLEFVGWSYNYGQWPHVIIIYPSKVAKLKGFLKN
jgi:hypothetical protein